MIQLFALLAADLSNALVPVWVALVTGLPPTILAIATLVTAVRNGRQAKVASAKADVAAVAAGIAAERADSTHITATAMAETLETVKSNTNGSLEDLRSEVRRLTAELEKATGRTK